MSTSKGRVARRSPPRAPIDGDAGATAPSPAAPRLPPPALPRLPPLAEYVGSVLRADILSGRQPPGTRLIEATVMERTGVSRTPVREGLRMLEGEGLVVTHRGRGTFVTYRLTPDEALLIYDVRLLLEPRLTAMAAERMTPETLGRIKGVLGRFVDAIDAADPREAGQRDADLHMAIYVASGSALLNVLRGYWMRLQLELSERVYIEEVPRRFVAEHRSIFDALRDGDAARAQQKMTLHIEHGRAVIVKALKG
ncbi:MAG TPA: GntR family transcriptional regulator [Solirubrobacteraceae bacterium]